MKQALRIMEEARDVVVLTGAGMSAESGVPTFRDAQTGLWEKYSPEDLATMSAFEADPDLVWSWYRWRARMVRACEPHQGHQALGTAQAGLAQQGGRLDIVTQNVDDLHERGGADVLAHLHGSLYQYRCASCAVPADYDPGYATEAEAGSEADLDRMMLHTPPACGACAQGVLRPGIVWFGESLPMEAFDASLERVRSCDVALVVGTSALVQPAATLPYVALQQGTAVIEVNPAVTPFSDDATVHISGGAATVLPQLLAPFSV